MTQIGVFILELLPTCIINHPVKIDIAGTCETVNNTYKDMLELCYQTFYHPHNMMLFVVGNINPEELIGVH